MRKILLLMLLLSVFMLKTFAQSKKNDLDREHLKGKVKTIIGLSFLSPDSLSKGPLGRIDTIHFDKYGNIKSAYSITFTKDTLTKNIVCKHDFKKNKSAMITYGNDNGLFQTDSAEYDENGNPLKGASYSANGYQFSKSHFIYDKNQKLSRWTVYHMGELFLVFTYQYDEKGFLYLRNEQMYSEKTLTSDITYKYNMRGDERESSEGYLFEYEYDEKGNWIIKKSLSKKNGLTDPLLTAIYLRTIEYYSK